MASTGNSVRHRVLRHSLAKIKPTPSSESDLPPLGPDEMQLYSYLTPGLSTGLYDIIAEQTVCTSDSGQSKTIRALNQSFFVGAPKYSIDPALIHSTFPHQGVAAQANILPHVVLNDPHLPWQTEIGTTSMEDTLRIPWLAVIAFEQSELKLQLDDPLFPPGSQGPPQSFTMTTRLLVGQLNNGSSLQCALPKLDDDLIQDSELSSKTIDVIFPKMDLFLALFGSGTSDIPQIDLDRFKYLAHARQVNTTHMTNSGIFDERQFSIVFSHRTGPPFERRSPAQPKRCVVHLVSLDWIHRIPASALTSNKRAALISLFSWTYDCIPPGTINFGDVMQAVGQNSGLYRTPDEMRSRMSNNRMKDRLGDGYTLVRYRVQTGEESVALMRGPLIPYADPATTWMDVHSNTGEDLKIIDTELGIIDISYCAAWQLGKSLAIADQTFFAALFRIRADVYNTSSKKAKEDALSQNIKAITSERVINSLSDHFADMKLLSKEKPNRHRWDRPSLIRSTYQHLAKDPGSVESHLRCRVGQLALATDGSHHTEFKDPISTDWDLVLNWMLDKLYLEKIPPWYLIPDPTWLPAESIRFFYIDRKWLSALVDGALSVANHLDAQDKVRQAIKDQLLKYLNEDIHPVLNHPPQIPSYGFYLRSVVVDTFPDLVVRAPRPTLDGGKEDPRAEILRQENIRKDIMFCLLDYIPSRLILSQPPHQQCFMFGDSTFTTDSFELKLRKVYSVRTDKPMDKLPKKPFSKGSDGHCEIYDWNTRTILVDKFTGLIHSTLQDAHQQDPEVYDKEVNASLVGIELNSDAYHLTFTSGQPLDTDSVTSTEADSDEEALDMSVTSTEAQIGAQNEPENESENESENEAASLEVASLEVASLEVAEALGIGSLPYDLASVPPDFLTPKPPFLVETLFASGSLPSYLRSQAGALPASGFSAEALTASRSRAGGLLGYGSSAEAAAEIEAGTLQPFGYSSRNTDNNLGSVDARAQSTPGGHRRIRTEIEARRHMRFGSSSRDLSNNLDSLYVHAQPTAAWRRTRAEIEAETDEGPPSPNPLARVLPGSRSRASAPPGSLSRASAPPGSGSEAEAATAPRSQAGASSASGSEAEAVTVGKSYDRPFKGVLRPRNVLRGPPRTSGFTPPALATPRTDKPPKPSRETMSTSISQFSMAPEIPSILLGNGKAWECSSRFSPACFPIGSPSKAKDDEPKYLFPSPNGSDVIIRLARNQSDPNSTDHIRLFEIRIPFGTTVHSLLTKPLSAGAVQMLNTVRFITDVGIHKNEIVIHLKPKAMLGLSPLSHNPDMSFIIKGANINPRAEDSTISIVELYTSKPERGITKIAQSYIHHVQAKK